MSMHTAIISVGSNIGNKQDNCQKGIDRLMASGNATLVKASRFYRTSPVDYLDQEWFVNAAVKFETILEPLELLEVLKAVQQQCGRTKSGIRFGPRVLDLDIIFYDRLVMNTPTLEIPHPRMHKRRFVLKPICDIDPAIIHPVLKQEMQILLKRLGEEEQKVFEYK